MKEAKHKLKRIDRVGENYELSRWVPLVKDVAEVSFRHFCKFYSEKWEELVGGCHNRSKKFYTWRISLPPEFHAMLFVSFRKVLHMENFSPPGISRHVASFIVFLCSLPPLSVLFPSLSTPSPTPHRMQSMADWTRAMPPSSGSLVQVPAVPVGGAPGPRPARRLGSPRPASVSGGTGSPPRGAEGLTRRYDLWTK